MVWLSTEADDQSSLHCVIVSTDVMSDHSGHRHASRGALKQFFSELHAHLQAMAVDAQTSAYTSDTTQQGCHAAVMRPVAKLL